ncbi:MAG: dihydropteroate synthase [Treponema sp.]|nr:dihydropteroate synthase [Treponema sp.]
MINLSLSDRTISTNLPAFVMAILNVTPDSFYEKSRGGFELARRIIDSGADIIDIGAESTRPGSDYVCEEEEIKRLIPVIKEIRKISDIPISVDTRKYSVMKACFEYGADILNDVSALEDDERLCSFASEKKIPVILMHKRGKPSQMQKNTEYSDVFKEVNSYLLERASFAEKNGIQSEKIIVDPGIGFGKNLSGNVSLIKNLKELCGGKYKILMALSRKSCIGEMTGHPVDERLSGTLAANLISVLNGASIVRVHDYNETIDILKVLSYIKP